MATAQQPRPGADETDPSRLLRALAHPVRMQLAQVMSSGSARNVSDLADAVGEAANLVSFHIRQLAKYGLVEKVDGPPGSTRRESWWRLVPEARRIELEIDPATDAERAARVVELRPLLTKQALDRLDGLLAAIAEPGGRGWHQEYSLSLTDAEAEELLDQITAIIARRGEQATATDERAGTRRWTFLVEGYPEVRNGR